MRRRRSSTSTRAPRATRTTRCRGPRTRSSTDATRSSRTGSTTSSSSAGWRRTATTTWTRSWRRRWPRIGGWRRPVEARMELWGGLECTVARVGSEYSDQIERTGHDRRLDDLDRFAGLGLRALRYPVLWERVERDGWAWSDERLGRLRELGVRPIVGLVHHGSGPRDTSLLDPRFPERLAAYARTVAERYPWVEDWTPVNEPLTTARFACLYGHWYPHQRSGRAFVVALLHQTRAI